MGVLRVAGKIVVRGARAATAQKAECEGCGKPLRTTKKNVCSTACAEFVARSY